MDKREEIEDSLEFCRDISYYTSHESTSTSRDSIVKPKKIQEYSSIDVIDCIDSTVVEEKEIAPTWMKKIGYFLLCVLISFNIAFFVNQYIVSFTQVIGHSMESTLTEGDFVLIDKITYSMEEPKQFDVIMFEYEKDIYYTKRIIGVPGQTVQILNGYVYVDGLMIEESYCDELIEDPGLAANPIHLGTDEYFVMGDNRNHSTDSRAEEVGTIYRNQIIGKVRFRMYPLDEIGRIH